MSSSSRYASCGAVALLMMLGPCLAAAQSSIHPPLRLRDSTGTAVMETGSPLSLRATCGGCHDFDFIATHTAHEAPWRSRLWSVAEATSSRPRTSDPATSVEMNCLVCHSRDPADTSWIEMIEVGRLEWAATASLANTSLVRQVNSRWRWNTSAFSQSGTATDSLFGISCSTVDNCGVCHGIATADGATAVGFDNLSSKNMQTLRTGEVYSPGLISNSAIENEDKEDLARPWDVHAERSLNCTDCHHSVNNPAFCQRRTDSLVVGLRFDGRREPLADYLRRPDHNMAGQTDSTAQSSYSLTCESCHDPEPTHKWLPYAARHFDKLACEVCHTAELASVAVESVDWTRIVGGIRPHVSFRGVEDDTSTGNSTQVTGFAPVLLARSFPDGRTRLAPFNLVTSWYWVAGVDSAPITAEQIALAAGSDSAHGRPQMAVFDSDGDGQISAEEVKLGSEEMTTATQTWLETIGFDSPRVVGEIQQYAINHGTTSGEWAIRECESCHSRRSRLSQAITLAGSIPAGIVPVQAALSEATMPGEVVVEQGGDLIFRPSTSDAGLYVLGHDSVAWANALGLILILLISIAVATHTSMRLVAVRSGKTSHTADAVSRSYTAYERFWHWVQAFAIILLLTTGMEIHFSDINLLGFAESVRLHNVLGFIVVANAVFAALYHLVSGKVRKFLPEPVGFFGQAMEQLRFYAHGMFRGHDQPAEFRRKRALNPLQQITYLIILNVLLPVQMLTGLLIWGAQSWRGVDSILGGLTLVAPIHALGSWAFAAFLLLHVYLTTTGPTPGAYLKAIALGGAPGKDRTLKG